MRTERIFFDDQEDELIGVIKRMNGCFLELETVASKEHAPCQLSMAVLVIASELLNAMEHLCANEYRPKKKKHVKSHSKSGGNDVDVAMISLSEAEYDKPEKFVVSRWWFTRLVMLKAVKWLRRYVRSD